MLEKADKQTKLLLSTMKISGALPLIQEFTRKSEKSTCIVQIFIYCNYIAETGILNLNISDHLAVFCTRKKVSGKTTKTSFSGRSYRNYVKEDFQSNIIYLNWDPF